MHPTYRGLAFLLSLGSLPVACGKDPGDDSTGNTTPGTDPTANTGTGTDATDATATVPTTTEPDGTTTTGASATGETTGGTAGTEPQMTTFLTTNTDGSSTGSNETEGPPPATDPTCIAYGAHLVECFPRYAQYQEYLAQQCEAYKGYALRADGQACQDAFEAFYVCISTVACDMLEGPACADEDMKISEMCPSLTDPSETTTDTQGETGGSSGSSGSSGSTG